MFGLSGDARWLVQRRYRDVRRHQDVGEEQAAPRVRSAHQTYIITNTFFYQEVERDSNTHRASSTLLIFIYCIADMRKIDMTDFCVFEHVSGASEN